VRQSTSRSQSKSFSPGIAADAGAQGASEAARASLEDLRLRLEGCLGVPVGRAINIEALCAAPPEVLAHSPSQMPLSCPVAPATQRELHKDGGGGGGGVAGRARAARAPKAKSCATSCGTSSATSCAASFTCLSLT